MLKSAPLLCVSYIYIGGNRCDAFVKLDPTALFHKTDNHDSKTTSSFVDDRIRLNGVESLHYRTFDEEQINRKGHLENEVTVTPRGRIPKRQTTASSIEAYGNEKKELNEYLDSIDRRYKRLYDESIERPYPTLSSGLTGFTTVWDWLMKSDSSKAVDQERRRQDAVYVLHHTVITADLLFNPKKYKMRRNYSPYVTEALIAGGFEILKTKEMIKNSFKIIAGIDKFVKNLIHSTKSGVRKMFIQVDESLRKVASKISTLDLLSMIVITYAITFLSFSG